MKRLFSLIFKLLLPVGCTAYLYYNRDGEKYVIATCLLLLTMSLAYAWTGWKNYQGESLPHETIRETLPDEMVFHYPSFRKYIWNVLFNPLAYRQETWNEILTIIYMAYISITYGVFAGYMIFISAIVCFIAYTKKRYLEDKDIHKTFTRGAIVALVRPEGFYLSITHLSTEKEKEHIHIQFTDWKDVYSLCAYGTFVQIRHSKNKFDVIFLENKRQLHLLKAMMGRRLSNPQEHLEVLTTQNAQQVLKGMEYTSYRIRSKECNSFHLGDSYISPIPSVPKDFKWPMFHKNPLTLIAQINCADLAKHAINSLLPKTGMLYFFYGWREMLLNQTGNDGCARIFYSDVPNDQLYFAKDEVHKLNQYHLLRQQKLVFDSQKTLPNFTKASRMKKAIANSNEETYRSVSWYHLGKDKPAENADLAFGCVLDEPTMITNRDLGLRDCEDLELLLEITLDKTDFYAYAQSFDDYSDKGINNREMYDQWNELPCQLFYYVPREDLKKLDFSNMRFVCHSLAIDNWKLDISDIK